MSETPWIDAIGARGGPLVGAALRFLAEHPGAPASPLPRRAEALRRIAHAIDAWAEREPEPAPVEDERFVEGAGALLACVLLDHVKDGAHASREGAHRVRLGRYGFFDPFRAVESALEGPDARRALIDEVARAEAEAEERAGIGRALRVLEARLGSMRPDLVIRGHFEATVQLDGGADFGRGTELDLARVLSATEGEDERAVERAIDKLVSMLPGGRGGADLAWDEARGVLLPRPVSEAQLALISGQLGRDALAARTVLGGALKVALVLGYEGRSRYVRLDELAAWRIDLAEALAVAIDNLGARSQRARFARVDTPLGPWVAARTGDGLDGARILLPTLHDVLAPELGTPFFAAVPHRDALFACAREPRALGEAMMSRARDDAARAPHRVSDLAFEVSATRVTAARDR